MDRACGSFWEGEEGKREGVIAPFLWQLSDVGARQPYPKYDMGRQGREASGTSQVLTPHWKNLPYEP